MNEKKKEYKVLEWNINMRSAGKYIPKFVSEAIIEQNAAIVILTEFVFCEGKGNANANANANDNSLSVQNFLNKTFDKKVYDYYPKKSTSNTNKKVNEVVIAWKIDKFNLNKNEQIFSEDCSQDDIKPNFLTVPLVTKDILEKELRVAGVRITMNKKMNYVMKAERRYHEMKSVYFKLDELADDNTSIIIAGDLNNFQRGTPIREWNFNRITCNRGDYTPYTPNGSSWDHPNNNNEFPEDHFITKNCYMENCKYDRQFTQLSQQQQQNGVYNGDSLSGIKSPNPDHAMLIGMLIL